MKIGYARTALFEGEAGLAREVRRLAGAGCGRVFSERTAANADRPQRDAALAALDHGDILAATGLERLARSAGELAAVAAEARRAGARLQILDPPLDTAEPAGRAFFTAVAAIVAFERKVALERQREGVAKAKAAGKYKGRKPTARAQAADVIALKAQGATPTQIARQLGIGRASVYRALGPAPQAPASGKPPAEAPLPGPAAPAGAG